VKLDIHYIAASLKTDAAIKLCESEKLILELIVSYSRTEPHLLQDGHEGLVQA
jgi:hypothetical protein